MTSKFDHIKLGRAFRPFVLSTLKGEASWPAYLQAHGFAGRSQDMTNAEIKTACEALGVDLDALYVGFFSNAVRAAGAAPVQAIIDNAAEDRFDSLRREQDNEKENDDMTKPAGLDASTGESFEGRDIETTIAEALAPASVHMTPHLASIMPGLIRPLVEAAVRGPRVETKTVTVVETKTVDADGAPVHVAAPAAPACKMVRRATLAQCFAVRKSNAPEAYRYALDNITLDVCDALDAPDVDSDYAWNVGALCELAAQHVAGLNAWIYGAAGTGKTEGAKQFAARLGRPFVRIAIERTTEPAELIGQEMPARGGGMKWTDGKLTRAFRIPYCVILIDEPTLLRSGTLAVLQTALDMRELYLPTGETVKAAPGVFIIAADNTAGCGDDSGRYVDTAPVNAAFLDRFALKTQFDFLSPSVEADMLSSRTGVHPVAARLMVDYAALTRRDADAGKLTMGVTTRRLLAWARVVKAGVSSVKAFNGAIITGAAPEDREVLAMLATQSLASAHAQIDSIVRGLVDPNAPVVDPHAQGGIGATADEFPNDDIA